VSEVLLSWKHTTSGELCQYITSGSRDWKKYYSDEGALFIRTEDINTDKLDLSDAARVALPKNVEGKRSRLEPGDLLMTITGANVGKVAIVPDDIPEAYVSQSVGLMRLRDKRFGKYIYYYLQGERSGRQYVMKMVYGMGRPVLSLQNLREIPVPLPDLDEQREIVAEIEKQFTRLEAGVAGLRRMQANLKRYRAAVLKSAFEGKLVPTEAELARQEGRAYGTGAQLLERILAERRQKWNENGKYKEPAKPETKNLMSLPEGWAWCFADALFCFVTSGSRGWARYYSDDGPIFLRIGNLDHGSIQLDLREIQHVSPPRGVEGTRTKVEEGDFLISITADVGMVAIVPKDLSEAYINQHVALARPVDGSDRRYLAWYLAAEHGGQKEFSRLQRGATKAGLGLDDIRAVLVPLPPLPEQQRIVSEVERRLSVVEELEAVVNANLQRAIRLRQSILQRAFEGTLLRTEKESSVNDESLPLAAEPPGHYEQHR
jgi:type I restriction enzyme S subunit